MSSKTNRMTAETWARLEAVFNEAFELEGAARERFLAQACGEDLALRREVEALLSTVQSDNTRIERMIGEAAETTIEQQADATGVHIGPYRVVRTIGTGGMGSVYLAKRDDKQFRQRVAIKLVNSYLVNPETRARFLSERQILATLEHPNIARLLDGGDTEEGAPYLVMEYIQGLPVTTYCDQNCLSIDDRLEIFRKICQAVHYAHQNLIVHRDIKPGNILVTHDGIPKLLDFGIAKILDTERFDRTVALTQAGDRLLTPENASPEQVLGRPVTTASDVYSLGVLFFELVAGRRPHDVRGLTPGELERTICEVEPPAPSSTLTDAGRQGGSQAAHPAEIARLRGTTPERLRRTLSGDIDNIVLAALRKEPERRYGSAFALAEDVRRHQEGEPIWARKDTWSYRSGKFVRRHMFGVLTAAVAMLALVVFAVTMYVQANRIAREADIKTQVIEFIVSVFEVADPSVSRGRTFTAEEIVDEGAERIAKQANLDPQVRATIMDTIGTVYGSLGLYDKALPLLESALQTRREVMPAGHKDIAASLMSLGKVRYGTGDWDQALSLLNEALKINRQANGNDHESVARTLNTIGHVWRMKDEFGLAEENFRASLTLYTRLFGAEDQRVGAVLSDLAQVERVIGNLAQAEELGRRALEINRRTLGVDHPFIVYDLTSLATTLKAQRRFDEAWPYYEEALASAERIYAGNLTHPDYIAPLVNVGQFHIQVGNLDEAEAAFRRALELEKQGDVQAFVAYDMTELARVLRLQGNYEEAEALAREALEIYGATFDTDHAYVATPLTTLGGILTETGRAELAESYLRRALAIHRNSEPPKPVPTARTEGELGETLMVLGRYAEAEPLLRTSYQRLSEHGDGGDAEVSGARERLLRLYDAWGRPDQAESLRAEPAAQ